MRNVMLSVGLVVVTLGVVTVVAHADHDEDERVEKLMEKTHEGKRSPYRQLRAQAEAAAPAWPVVAAALPRFEEMSRALLESSDADVKGSADGYVDAVQEVAQAARKRDAATLRAAFQSLTQSCGDCHFKGGVGGELDD